MSMVEFWRSLRTRDALLITIWIPAAFLGLVAFLIFLEAETALPFYIAAGVMLAGVAGIAEWVYRDIRGPR